jgi:hypothetical protein
MDKNSFIHKFSDLSKRLSRRVTDDLLLDIADILKVSGWNENIVNSIITDWTMNPPKDFTGESIREAYWTKFRSNMLIDERCEKKDPLDPIVRIHFGYFLRFSRWDGRNESYKNREQFKSLCGYDKSNNFEKEMLDAYVDGRSEAVERNEIVPW